MESRINGTVISSTSIKTHRISLTGGGGACTSDDQCHKPNGLCKDGKCECKQPFLPPMCETGQDCIPPIVPIVVKGTENVVTHALPNLSRAKKWTFPLFSSSFFSSERLGSAWVTTFSVPVTTLGPSNGNFNIESQ